MEVFHFGAENRKYPRVSYKDGVKCQLRGQEDSFGEAAQDLSEGGIRIRTNVFMPIGQEVALGIQLGGSAELVEVTGRVVWVRYNPYSEVYQVGVEFAQESAFQRSRIGRFTGKIA